MKNKNSNDRLGLVGKLGSIVQSVSISAGSFNEKETLDAFKELGFLDISETFKVTQDSKVDEIATFENFLTNFESDKRYIGRHLKVKYKTEYKQIDLVIVYDNKIWLPELKSSSNFDTKKSKSEVISCVEVAKCVLTQLGVTRGVHNSVLVIPLIVCWFAESKLEIEAGFKKHLAPIDNLKNDTNVLNLINSELFRVGAELLKNNISAPYILKHFARYGQGSDILSKENVYKYMVEYMTGAEFCSYFKLPFVAINNNVVNKSIALLRRKPLELYDKNEISLEEKNHLLKYIELMLSESQD